MASETALITGASSGIGLELARLFAADGADLVIVARRRERLETLRGELQKAHHVKVHVLPKDLTDPHAPDEIFEWARTNGVAVDVLVNNAGFGARGSVVSIEARHQVDMLQVNVTALTHLTRLFLPGMLERRRGAILNLGSSAGFQPIPHLSVYAASKAYVLAFTEGLAEELRGRGVTATVLAPGATATEFAAVAGMERSRPFKAGAMDAATVARAGYDGMRAGRVLVLPNFRSRLGAFGVRLVPRALVRRAAAHAISR